MNPLLFCLKESQHLEKTPREALVKLMMLIHGCQGPQVIGFAVDWHEAHGEPTFVSLEAWCRDFSTDPDNAETYARLVERHKAVIASFTAEEKAEIGKYMPEVFDA